MFHECKMRSRIVIPIPVSRLSARSEIRISPISKKTIGNQVENDRWIRTSDYRLPIDRLRISIEYSCKYSCSRFANATKLDGRREGGRVLQSFWKTRKPSRAASRNLDNLREEKRAENPFRPRYRSIPLPDSVFYVNSAKDKDGKRKGKKSVTKSG